MALFAIIALIPLGFIVANIWRRRPLGYTISCVGIFSLLLLSNYYVSIFLAKPLEYDQKAVPDINTLTKDELSLQFIAAKYIVTVEVTGGGEIERLATASLSHDCLARILEAVRLYHALPELALIFPVENHASAIVAI